MQNIQFTLTADEANLVLAALGELPAKTSIGLILKLQEQAKQQVNAPNQSAE